MDDTPLLPKKRGLLTRTVIAGVSIFCLFLVLIIGVVVLSNKTASSKPHGMLVILFIQIDNYRISTIIMYNW